MPDFGETRNRLPKIHRTGAKAFQPSRRIKPTFHDMKTNSEISEQNSCIYAKNTSLRWMITAVVVMPLVSSLITTSHAQNDQEKRSFMFERFEHVGLVDKEIPEFHKRDQVTDTQGRSIKGQWIAIDRKNNKVKFRRTDGKEYDIDMANLAPQDRRYAELETGYFWQMDPPPTPIDIIKEDILAFDSMDATHIHLRCVNPNDPSILYVPKFQLNMLTSRDRALIKEKTGKDVPILPRPKPDGSTFGWKYPRPVFGHQVPKFTPSYFSATLGLMHQTFSLQEMVDSVRARTLTSAFIHEFFQFKWDEAEPEKKLGTKPLADILKILGETPSPEVETKSIKPKIAELKLSPYEEKVPRDPAQPLRFIRGDRSILSQPGIPIDGELQAYQFIAQFLRLSANQPRIPLATLLENTKQSFTGVGHIIDGRQTDVPPEQRRKFYMNHDILPGIEKTHGYKGWRVFVPLYQTQSRAEGLELEFIHQWTLELIRQHIRKGSPVYARMNAYNQEMRNNGTQLVIIGFKAEKGKPLMFETIGIKGSLSGGDTNIGEYQVTEAFIPESEVATSTVTFLEVP